MCDKSDFSYDKESDEFTLGHHLFHDHKLNCKADFDNSYIVSILDISSPKVLDVKEHKFIHFLNSQPLSRSPDSQACRPVGLAWGLGTWP